MISHVTLLLCLCVAYGQSDRQRLVKLNIDLYRQRGAVQTAKHACEQGYTFRKYTASAWEQQWYVNAGDWGETACKHMKEQVGNSQKWLDSIASVLPAGVSGLPNATALQSLDQAVFSRFEYVSACDLNDTINVWIEPLVGLLRNPYVPRIYCHPHTANVGAFREPEDRSYILPTGMTAGQLSALYPGRRYLFDIGTNYFNTSLSWFVAQGQAFGAQFDAIFAWEAKLLLPEDYWRQVPADVRTRLHLYNIPVTGTVTSPEHPFQILKSIWKPGDYVLLKLDIDLNSLEDQLMTYIAEDAELRGMISEMYYELHFDTKETKRLFRLTPATTPYTTAISTFRDLREQGLRIHYWP